MYLVTRLDFVNNSERKNMYYFEQNCDFVSKSLVKSSLARLLPNPLINAEFCDTYHLIIFLMAQKGPFSGQGKVFYISLYYLELC